MSRYKRKIDNNQKAIVSALRDVPGVTVETRHDDILVGFKGNTFWYEIKNPNTVSPKTGEVVESALKESQKKIHATWTGHYKVVWSVEQILSDITGG